jgi:hypothetical protein
MEQRAPRTAAFASTVATMSLFALLVNSLLGKYPGREGQRVLFQPLFNGFLTGTKEDYWASTGWSQQEWIWLTATICLGIVVIWGRSERPVPELPQRRSVEEQIADFESASTPIATLQTNAVTETTSSIISSIVGEKMSIDSQRVESAAALLSSGELGSYAASVVTERNSDIESRTFESELQPQAQKEIVQENRDFVSDGPAYIPLPGKEEQEEPPQPIRSPDLEFVSDGPAKIPLPDLPDLDEEHTPSAPLLPSLDDLFEQNEGIPDMPNLDDLF